MTKVASGRPGRGIAPQRAASRERVSIASRVRRAVHEKLAESASIAGRSLSEEIETRLERSVADEELFGGAHNFAIGRLVAHTLSVIEVAAGQSWIENDVI